MQTLWLIFSVFLMLLVAGCSSTSHRDSSSPSFIVNPNPVSLNNPALVKKQLWAQFKQWQGTPYRYGGQSEQGVDCSAYVQHTYASRLGVLLPRTTRTQIKQGIPVDKTQLKIGDVLFFKVARNTLHNGIYLGDGQFMHASSSKGVTVSQLDLPYWQQTYLHARRYLD